jgi:hypothetical protein
MLLCAWLARPALMDAAFSTFIIPCLGFLFLPFTTLMYVFLIQGVGGLQGLDWLWLPGGRPGPRHVARRGRQPQSDPRRLSWLVRREGVVGCIAYATQCGDTAWPGARPGRTRTADGVEAEMNLGL